MIQGDADKINRLILGDCSCRFLLELAIPDAGRPDNIDRLVLLFFAAGRPYMSNVAVSDNS
jgi:hypothetical protein